MLSTQKSARIGVGSLLCLSPRSELGQTPRVGLDGFRAAVLELEGELIEGVEALQGLIDLLHGHHLTTRVYANTLSQSEKVWRSVVVVW